MSICSLHMGLLSTTTSRVICEQVQKSKFSRDTANLCRLVRVFVICICLQVFFSNVRCIWEVCVHCLLMLYVSHSPVCILLSSIGYRIGFLITLFNWLQNRFSSPEQIYIFRIVLEISATADFILMPFRMGGKPPPKWHF